MRAVLSFRGPCYPAADSFVDAIIEKGVNPLTLVPWGHAAQSGGFATVCTRAGVAECASGSTSSSSRRLLADTSTDTGATSTTATTNTTCTNQRWYLYLDATHPSASSGWSSATVIKRLKSSISQGQLQGSLAGTSMGGERAGGRAGWCGGQCLHCGGMHLADSSPRRVCCYTRVALP